MKFFASLIPVALLVPSLAFAQQFGELDDFVGNITDFINGTIVPLIFAIAFIVFLWGVVNFFIIGGGDEGKREEGRKFMLYGIAGFVIMVSVWGIVNLLSAGFGFTDENIQNIPNAPTENN